MCSTATVCASGRECLSRSAVEMYIALSKSEVYIQEVADIKSLPHFERLFGENEKKI